MKIIKWILILCLNWVAACVVIFGITLGIAFVLDLMYPNITDTELLTKQNLIKAYEIGTVAGVIIFIILRPISKKISDYVWNWKKKRTVGSFVDNGEFDPEKSLSNIENRGEKLN